MGNSIESWRAAIGAFHCSRISNKIESTIRLYNFMCRKTEVIFCDFRLLLIALTILLIIGNVELNPGPPKQRTNDEIFQLLTQNADKLKKLDQLTAIKKELTGISSTVTNLTSDVKQIKGDLAGTKSDVSLIQKQNSELRKTVQSLDNKLRKNNIVIYGIDNSENESQALLEKNICTFINSKLNVDVASNDIETCYRLGKNFDKPRPVLVRFCNYKIKSAIFGNVKNLKNSGFAISDDLTPHERGLRAKLIKYKNKASNMQLRCRIYKNKLVVEGISYSIDELANPDLFDSIKDSLNNTEQDSDNINDESSVNGRAAKRNRESNSPEQNVSKKNNNESVDLTNSNSEN